MYSINRALIEEWQEKAAIEKTIRNPFGSLPQAMWLIQQTCGTRCSDQMTTKLNLPQCQKLCGGHPTLPINLSTTSQKGNMMVMASFHMQYLTYLQVEEQDKYNKS